MNCAKKLTAMLLVLVMMVAMTGLALAATVVNESTHTYKAYQIFTGTQAEDEGTLGDIQWGTGVSPETFLAALKEDERFSASEENLFAACETAIDVANVLDDYKDDSDVAKAFANVAAAYCAGEGSLVPANGEQTGLAKGYYLVVDVTAVENGDALNSALLQVEEDGTFFIKEKYTVPSVDKDIVDAETGVENTDAAIGDTVKFRLTGTLPSNLYDYEKYVYVFHDTLSAGLKLNAQSIKVTLVNGETTADITSSAVIDTEDADLTDGHTFSVQFADLKQIEGVTSSSTIVAEYEAVVNSSAVIGSAGNTNKAKVEYSNNPNYNGDGSGDDTDEPTGETPEDVVIVFTYELDVIKTDDNAESPAVLQGAEFVLLSEDQTKVAQVAEGKLVAWLDVPAAVEGVITYPEGTKLVSDETGAFGVYGLDAGTYYLKETKAPAGYNQLTVPIKLVVSAQLSEDEEAPALTKLEITVGEGEAAATQGGKQGEDGTYTGEVAVTVINSTGATLPETGGAGTTMLYVGGGLLIVVAIVLLVFKKKK